MTILFTLRCLVDKEKVILGPLSMFTGHTYYIQDRVKSLPKGRVERAGGLKTDR